MVQVWKLNDGLQMMASFSRTPSNWTEPSWLTEGKSLYRGRGSPYNIRMVRIIVSIIMACSFNLPGTCISERQHTQALAEALGHPDSLIYCVYHFMGQCTPVSVTVCIPRDGSSTCADDSLTLDRLWCHTIPPTVHLSPTLRSTGAGLIHNKTMMHVFQSAAFRRQELECDGGVHGCCVNRECNETRYHCQNNTYPATRTPCERNPCLHQHTLRSSGPPLPLQASNTRGLAVSEEKCRGGGVMLLQHSLLVREGTYFRFHTRLPSSTHCSSADV
ncbi:hypothetical protein F7725_023155 [Dissostichus mawsoni]|uniref:Uncharacterized protein n=1 Tax=Dissostichus mawsoni TaxID=36200 RepID=A0A7J5Z097_DISMA|nr:hypothetical protein F7725_023155 [Dissostichus mawsoni]